MKMIWKHCDGSAKTARRPAVLEATAMRCNIAVSLPAVVGPKVGGTLIGMGLTLTMNFIIFSVPLIIAAIATRLIKSENVS